MIRHLNLMILILFFFLPTRSHADGYDKYAHVGISFAATTLTYGVLKVTFPRSKGWHLATYASGLTLLAGLAKELFLDERADAYDMLANAAGSVGAAGCVIVFEF